ncbi:Na+/H+ antiporter NhaA [Tenacibaculum sp. UWU-22]|uniref:Na+/H+ antiporter NhaA n=1 Tax=Tenacibaculum sp. UWU-22 TaxID=3234187 RepID=UPI0034DAE81D
MVKLLNKYRKFLKKESATGILLVMATLLALIVANTFLNKYYIEFMKFPFTIGFPNLNLTFSLHHWVNDGLMALFFLLVGLEIKSELRFGRLKSFRSAIFPSVSSLFGALFPAIIYFALNYNTKYIHGWAIPMSTDIAFVLGIVAILGSRIPTWVKVFVTTIAVVDDLIAILVIAFFYTDTITWSALGIAGISLLILLILNYKNVNKLTPYLVIGFILWWSILASGIHATIAGVILAFTIPLRRTWSIAKIQRYGRKGLEYLEKNDADNSDKVSYFLEKTLLEIESPLKRLERKLHGPVYHFIMPLFAFVNAGIVFQSQIMSQIFHTPLTWGIIFGVLIGKPLGILLAIWILTTFFYKDMPRSKYLWKLMLGIGLLCGMGFTMSLFVTTLSFTDTMIIEESKIAILLASFICGVLGYFVLLSTAKSQKAATLEDS